MPAKASSHTPDPRRSEINRLNRQKSRGMSPEGRARVRAATLLHRPWEYSTGPRTEAGKARSALNGMRGREDASMRQLKADLDGVFNLIHVLAATRRSLT